VSYTAPTPDQIEEITARYDLGRDPRVVGAPTRGELGQVWRLETSTGTWAVKRPFDPEPEEQALSSACFQEAAVGAGVPAPAVVRTRDGRVLLDLDGGQFRVYSWVDVQPLDVSLDPASVGELLASIHRLERSAPGPVHPWYTEPVGAEAWDELVGELLGAGMPRAEYFAAFREELVALELLLAEPSHLQQLHLDLWADNVRATGAGGLCVLDWDNSGAGDPSQELAVVLFEFCAGSAPRAELLYEAYVDAGGSGRVTRAEDFSMAVAQLGHIFERQCRTWLRNESPEARERAADAMEEFVSRPLTRQVVADILDAVT
jgi:Ser/Thr protein kinase RdoA (MazF antagonist)